jgi:cobalt/nickel transport system permease protein
MTAYTARRAAAEPQHARRIPLMGVMAAFVFAAQMINFSIPGTGSSGHIAGGLLLAILLGPFAAFIAMVSVLTVQCLLFADGGLLALGCNILNMGFWPCFIGLPVYRFWAGASAAPRRAALAAVIASVVSLQLGAMSVVVETVLSGRSELPFTHFGAVMLGIHLPVGIVEGLVTAGVLRVLLRANDAAKTGAAHRGGAPLLAGIGLATLLVSGVLAWFTSVKPDGLEWSVAKFAGAAGLSASHDGVHAEAAATQKKIALMPDYQLPLSTPRLGGSIAGVSGAIVAGAVVTALGLAAAGVRRAKPRAETS